LRQVDFIIVGQGLAGTFLSFHLHKENKSFIVIDVLNENSASRVSSGIINPVTGRNFVKAWMIDALIPVAVNAYAEIEKLLGRQYFFQKTIHKYFPNEAVAGFFQTKASTEENKKFISSVAPENLLSDKLNEAHHGAAAISPAYFVDCKNLIEDYSLWLLNNNWLLAETFDYAALEISENGVTYKDINAKYIIFCEGYKAKNNPWFNYLPMVGNKGDFLLVSIPNFPKEYLVNHGIFIVPLHNDIFWVGSNYQHTFEDESPQENNRIELEEKLQAALKVPFKVLQHSCGIRPTIVERRPVVGIHPKYKSLGILNGLGTKGVSLAPYFSQQLAAAFLYNKAIDTEADIKRYSSMTNRTSR
jgi:glycine/D-amino acid oxidase-like deaminating enzyme